MGRRFLLDHDAVTGQFAKFEYDAGEDQFILNQGQDVSAIVENNREQYNANHGRHGDGLGHKVASIPLHIYFELRRQGIVQDPKAFKRWLNDPDNRAFRTAPGTV